MIFEDVCFSLLVDIKDYRILCNVGYTKGASFLLSFLYYFVIQNLIASYYFFEISIPLVCYYWSLLKCNFSLGLICNKYQCLSKIFLMFGRVLLNLSTSGILSLFAFFGFEVNKAFLVTSDILLS